MRSLIVGMALVAVTAPAWARAPAGPIPATATAQRTEPGRYWVFFAHNRASLQPDAEQVVAEAAQSFLRTGSTRISLVGSADSTGTAAYNQKLSERRAETVRAELVRLGVPAETITVRAEGENAPIVPTPRGVAEASAATATSPSTSPSARRRRRWPPPPRSRRRHPRRRHPSRCASALSSAASPATISRKTTAATPTPTICWATADPGLPRHPQPRAQPQPGRLPQPRRQRRRLGRPGRPRASTCAPTRPYPYIGANLGGIYGKGVQDGPLVGPEIGLKYDISDSTYFHVQTGYDYGFRNPWDKGIIQGGLGLGVRF